MNDNIAKTATCTICTFAENFSNSWTAVLFFRATTAATTAAPIFLNLGFDGVSGEM